MTASKRTQITIETDEWVVIRRRQFARAWCLECGREVDMVGLTEAGALTGMTPTVLLECIETGKWHVLECPEGTRLICLESLLKTT